MKRRLVLYLVPLIIFISAMTARAQSPIRLSHILKGYSIDKDSATLDISLHVANPGDTSVHNLTLSYVSLFGGAATGTLLNIGDVGAHQGTDVPFKLSVPISIGVDRFSKSPLLWAGKYIDAQGNLIEFPVESRGSVQ